MADAQAELLDAHERVTELEDKLACVHTEHGEIKGLAGPHFIFEGCNVHVRNAAGSTPAVNGTGNLVVGYNELSNFIDNHRTGSHNLVVGLGHTYSNYGGFIAGESNEVTGKAASVTGGVLNVAAEFGASVSGGSGNQALDDAASISGGRNNQATSTVASVSGGENNTASGPGSSISGGFQNTASGTIASVSGGSKNTASDTVTSVSGGVSGIRRAAKVPASAAASAIRRAALTPASAVAFVIRQAALTPASAAARHRPELRTTAGPRGSHVPTPTFPTAHFRSP